MEDLQDRLLAYAGCRKRVGSISNIYNSKSIEVKKTQNIACYLSIFYISIWEIAGKYILAHFPALFF